MIFSSCQTVTTKIDEKTKIEEKKLSEWLNRSERDLKTVFGQPDKIEFLENGNRNYIYAKKKYNIKCLRRFEINSKNKIIGFRSNNCF